MFVTFYNYIIDKLIQNRLKEWNTTIKRNNSSSFKHGLAKLHTTETVATSLTQTCTYTMKLSS